VEWGPGVYGLGAAASRYFGKSPAELSPKEVAFLVRLIPGPVSYQRSFDCGTVSPAFEGLVAGLLTKLLSAKALTEEEYGIAMSEQPPSGWCRSQGVGRRDPWRVERMTECRPRDRR
jgi:monofunctional biosynthetic peptidoglycan transglycosylase